MSYSKGVCVLVLLAYSLAPIGSKSAMAQSVNHLSNGSWSAGSGNKAVNSYFPGKSAQSQNQTGSSQSGSTRSQNQTKSNSRSIWNSSTGSSTGSRTSSRSGGPISPTAHSTQSTLVISGGSQILDATSLNNLSNLIVTRGATAVIEFNTVQSLSVLGNIRNNGSIYAVSTNPTIATAIINSGNLRNGAGALLTTVLPTGGLFGLSNLVPELSLSLSATHSILNNGTISASGNLFLSGGNAIINQGQAIAVHNISAQVGSGGLTNSGSINSASGNISISSAANQNLLVNNTGGTIEALAGSINFTTMFGSASMASAASSKLNVTLSGGDLISEQLNVSTDGSAAIDVNNLTGTLNVSAGDLAVSTKTQELQLGALNITGDPTFFNPGDIQISQNLTFPGQNLAIIAGGDVTAAAGVSIDLSSAGNAGNLLIVAGVDMSPTSGTGSTTSGTPDSTTALTLSGPSSSGGDINLTGITSINTTSTGGSSGGSGGSVTLIAYQNQAGTAKGNITVPGAISTGTTNNSVFAQNGNVLIIAGASGKNGTASINLGSINTSGNSISPVINNGIVDIFSATPQFLMSPNQNNTPVNVNTLVGNYYPGQTIISVSDITGITAGSSYIFNSTGANSETVQVSAVTPGPGLTGTLTLNNPIALYHGPSENIMASTTSVITFANAGPLGPIIQNAGTFGPGTAQSGNIFVGAITAGANVVIGTNPNPSAANGNVVLNGSIGLTQNPGTATNYNDTPTIQVTGQSVSVSSTASISSVITNCSTCQDVLNIVTSGLNNSGTLSGSSINITNRFNTTALTVTNLGKITGPTSSTNTWLPTNPILSISSAAGITMLGNGTISEPGYSVVSLTAADNNSIFIASTTIIQSDSGGLVTLSAQGASGAVNLGPNAILAINGGTSGGGPYVIISSPTLNFSNGSGIEASGSSDFLFTSGALTQSPQPLTMNVAAGASALISTAGTSVSGTTIVLRPTDGQNIVFTSSGPGASLGFVGGTVELFTGTAFGTSITGSIPSHPNISVTATSSLSSVNPNGGITGIAFEPDVGPAINFPSTFTLNSAYTYGQVLLLMAPIAATGMFQSLGTYNQGSALILGADPTVGTSYVLNGADRFVIQAAKQLGLQVTAGANVENTNHSTNVAGTEVEAAYAVQQAATYGNVKDIVIGNESIVADPPPPPPPPPPNPPSINIDASITDLITVINFTQNLRTSTGFNSTTLPITTRQTYGALSGAAASATTPQTNDIAQQTVWLLNGCTGCDGLGPTIHYTGVDGHVYADVYPYYDSPIVNYLGTFPNYPPAAGSISQSTFTPLVTNGTSLQPPQTTGIQQDLNGTVSAFSTAAIVPQLWVAETGWATTTTPSAQTSAPQANLTYSTWDYSAMQSWSSTSKSTSGTPYQIPITGYFEAYDEPVKYTSIAGQGGEPNFGIWTATGTTSTAPNQQYYLTGITQKFSLPIFNQNPVAPLPTPPGGQQNQQSSTSNSLALTLGTPNSNNSLANQTSLISALGLSEFFNTLSSIQRGLSASGATIVPTDVNPQIQTRSDVATAEDAAIENTRANLFAGSELTQPIQGNLIYTPSPFGLNPSDSHISFAGSNLLLSPDHDLSVNTLLGKVEIDSGAAVMLSQSGGELAIYTLHDDHSSAVRVTVDGESMDVPVGRQLVLTTKEISEFDKLDSSKMSHRHLKSGRLGKARAYMAEFSLPSALSTVRGIRELMKSDKKADHLLAQKLLKTAAAMSVLDKERDPFQTASNKN